MLNVHHTIVCTPQNALYRNSILVVGFSWDSPPRFGVRATAQGMYLFRVFYGMCRIRLKARYIRGLETLRDVNEPRVLFRLGGQTGITLVCHRMYEVGR